MPLPQALRTAAPSRLRDHPGLRAVALASGLIPPRTMHTDAEAAQLATCARNARCVAELGVYEGSSALVFVDALRPDAELHLIDPFIDESGWAMRPGWRGASFATRRAVGRRVGPHGPALRWHIARSQDVGRRWDGPEVDLVFIDGDHSPAGCREDWDVWHPHVRLGGVVAFHDARLDEPHGWGSPGATSVVNELFRPDPPAGWRMLAEVDSLVAVQRSQAAA